MIYVTLLLAILPVGLICFIFYKWVDTGTKEDWRWLGLAFLFGIVAAVPAFLFQSVFDPWLYENVADAVSPFVQSFAGVALVEEALKWLPIFFIVRRFAKWDEYSDGVMYMVFCGMGFALVENILYALQGEIWVAVLRAFTAVPAHAVFGVLMGFFLSRFQFVKHGKRAFLITSLVLPILAHGIYDFFIIQTFVEWLMLLALVILIVCLYFSLHLIKQARVGDQNLIAIEEEE